MEVSVQSAKQFLQFICICICCTIVQTGLRAQTFLEANGLAGSRQIQSRDALAHPEGGWLLCGDFTDSLELGSVSLQLESNGRQDGYVARVNADGSVQWAVALTGGRDELRADRVALAHNGTVWVAGRMVDTLRIGNDTLLGSPAPRSLFVVALDGNTGNRLRWATETDAEASTELDVKAIATSEDAVYVVGQLKKGTAQFGSFQLENPNNKDAGVMVKWGLDGNLRWASTLLTAGTEGGTIEAAVVAGGQLFVAGRLKKTDGLVGRGANTVTLPNSSGNDLGFVAALDTAGAALWAQPIASAKKAEPKWIAVHPSGVVIAGEFETDARFGNTVLTTTAKKASFVALYTTAGQAQWALITDAPTQQGEAKINALATGADGVVYAGGEFKNTVSVDTIPNLSNTSGFKAAFLMRILPNGRARWLIDLPSNTDVELRAMAVGSTGQLYAQGTYTSDLLLGDAVGHLPHTGITGLRGLFFLRLDTAYNPARRPTHRSTAVAANGNELKFYPNPTSDFVTLEIPPNVNANGLSLRATDVLGRSLPIQIAPSFHPNQIAIHVSQWPHGLNFVHVHLPSGDTQTFRVLVLPQK